MNYIPLQVLSGYSFLASGLKIEDIVNVSKSNGLDFCCVSEQGNMYSFPHLFEECQKNNLRPIYGIGLNIKINNKELLVYLYIENEQGYLNLCSLMSQEKNLDNLNKFSQGLTLVVPTISNPELSEVLLRSEEDYAKILYHLSKNFASTYIGVELYAKNDKGLIEKYREFAKEHHYPLLCFPKHLYIKKSDALTLKILQAIKNEDKILSKEEVEGPYFFLGEKAINSLYTKEERENTFKLCENTSFDLMKKRGKLLEYPIASNLTLDKYLEFACLQNAKLLGIELNDQYLKRLDYEISVIDKMGYCSYFLIVQDYVNYAKSHHIPVGPGRGSAAGSLVSYLLGITEIDPLKYHLMFERFLNPERVTMPDIDIDIADYARQDVIDYIKNKYGESKMANIITFQTMGAKQSIRDIGRVFSINNSDINTICKQIKQPSISLDEALRVNKDLQELYNDPYFKRIIDLAKKIEGFPRQDSLHAAGIIINNDPLFGVVPTKFNNENQLVCEFEAPYLEKLGFLKMDILGLKNLSILQMCTEEVKLTNPSFNLKRIPLNDTKTFEVLNAGLTQGIFQLESEGITQALKKIKIQSFDDIVALLALYRPGPMDNIEVYARRKNQGEKISYLSPVIEEILKPTYGVIIYQEQIMEIVQKIALFSLAEADLFRRAISKKDKNKLDELKTKFVNGAIKNHIEEETANKIFDLIEKFANYGFNKSHSVSYAMITYQLAYLKANYPLAFFATMLSFQSNSSEKFTKFSNDFNLFQIKLLLPNINTSEMVYKPSDGKILLPFTAIKGIPTTLAKAIIHERKAKLFDTLDEVIERLLPYGFTNLHFNALINSGALDHFKYNRETMRKYLPTLIQYVETTAQEVTLLSREEIDRFKPLIRSEKEDRNLDLEEEYKTLGVMISGSLFDRFSNYIKRNNIQEIFTVSATHYTLNIGIILTKVKEILTRSGKKMAIVTGFDNSQEIEVTIFDQEYQQFKNILQVGMPLLVRGYFRQSDNYGTSFIGEHLEIMEENK